VSAALGEAVAVSLLFWAAQGVSWALALSGHAPTVIAAWAPDVLFLAAGLAAVRRVA
jgi:lipopolysaccharide export LptBFGC system permease protein LptF